LESKQTDAATHLCQRQLRRLDVTSRRDAQLRMSV